MYDRNINAGSFEKHGFVVLNVKLQECLDLKFAIDF